MARKVYLHAGCLQLRILLQLLCIVEPELDDILCSKKWREMLKKLGVYNLMLFAPHTK
jgi:hypothetical protein